MVSWHGPPIDQYVEDSSVRQAAAIRDDNDCWMRESAVAPAGYPSTEGRDYGNRGRGGGNRWGGRAAATPGQQVRV